LILFGLLRYVSFVIIRLTYSFLCLLRFTNLLSLTNVAVFKSAIDIFDIDNFFNILRFASLHSFCSLFFFCKNLVPDILFSLVSIFLLDFLFIILIDSINWTRLLRWFIKMIGSKIKFIINVKFDFKFYFLDFKKLIFNCFKEHWRQF
jgi:hypothetical protein